LIAAEITGPREVDAVDGTATLDELAAMLRARTLAPSDLVNDGTGWQTLREFIPLLDEVDARDQRDRLRTWAMWGLVLVLAVAGFMAAGAYVRSQLGE
jgi:hypothetical protein